MSSKRRNPPELGAGHRQQIQRDLRRTRGLYLVVFVGVALEVAMGAYIWHQLSGTHPPWIPNTTRWTLLFSGVAALQIGAAILSHRRLLRPEAVLARLRHSLAAAGVTDAVAPEFLTVAAVRAVFLADVVVWILLQLITLYGVLLVVLTGQLTLLLGFATLSTGALLSVSPKAARMERLVHALRACAARERSPKR